LLPGNIVEDISAYQLSCTPSHLTGHVVTFTTTSAKKFVCYRIRADTAIFWNEKPFSLQLDGVDPTGLYENFPAITFDVVHLSGIRKNDELFFDSVHAEGAFGSVDGQGSFSDETLDCHFTILLKTDFIQQLSFVQENEINPDRIDYVVSVDLGGTFRQPHVTVTSELFQFSLKKNV